MVLFFIMVYFLEIFSLSLVSFLDCDFNYDLGRSLKSNYLVFKYMFLAYILLGQSVQFLTSVSIHNRYT